ncbi:hypothetical protein BOX15_Mlig028477g2 [Macrostomum lignano]|uniref:Fibronectin type-III domain-containing protein n=1 Tax=Macrostomum lignano TaxID=282301 RepID=A0A267DTW8_9PLAT|nr:hypothetical protein BOX15_Mlig028477g2 [Macrostomum lignano]
MSSIRSSSNTLSVIERTTMKLFNGTCVQACPLGYAVSDGQVCSKCADARNCARYCDPLLVHSIEDLEAVKGCTIMPQLIISLSDDIPDLEKRLLESFRDLTEIEESLMIINSPALTSLSFLSNLRVIHGKNSGSAGQRNQASQPASLAIEHNDFLQSLWNATNGRRLLVAKGKVRFYMNRRLCNHKITEFVKHTLNVTDFINFAEDLSPRTNGDLASCINRTFDILVGLVTSRSVMLHWPMLQVKDKRALLGYSIYYRQVRQGETVQYADPSTCEIRQWQTMFTACTNLFVPDNSSPNQLVEYSGIPVKHDGTVEGDDDLLRVSCHLNNCSQCVGDCKKKLPPKQCQFMVVLLKPASRYAMFVMPQLVVEQQQAYGSKSRIIYVDTMPTQPSPPHDFKVEFRSPSEMRLTWKPPLKPNGNVTHYLLRFKEMPSHQENVIYGDDCSDIGIRPVHQQQQQQQQQPTASSDVVADTSANRRLNFTVDCQKHCSCGVQPDLRQREDVIYFEDNLFKILFTRRPEMRNNEVEGLHKLKLRPNNGNESSSRSTGSRTSTRSTSDKKRTTTTTTTTTATTTTSTSRSSTTPMQTTTAPPTVAKPDCDNERCPKRITKQLDSANDNKRWTDGYVTVRGTEYTVTNLKHFTHYELSLIACQEEFRHPQYQTILHLCSNPARIIQLTEGLAQADRIPGEVTFQSPQSEERPGEVRLLWREPKNPNGVVRYYEVQYKGPSHRSWQYMCVSYREWLLSGKELDPNSKLLRTSRSVSDLPEASDNATANSSAGVGTVNEPAVRNGVKGGASGSSDDPSFALSGIGGVMLRELPQGTYQFQVRAVTSQGHGSWSPVASTEVSGRATTEMATILGLAGAMAVLLTCVLLGWLACRQRDRGRL